MTKTLAQMTTEVRDINTEKGRRAGDNTVGDYIALLHSELSEALEAYRDHLLADATESTDHDCPQLVNGLCLCPVKPEGVGSEFADVLIRLLDMCDVLKVELFDMDMELGDVAPLFSADTPVTPTMVAVPHELTTFGDFICWLHRRADQVWEWPQGAPLMLRALVTVAERHGIDLQAEYDRKVEYNRTRPYQHGGRTLNGAGVQ